MSPTDLNNDDTLRKELDALIEINQNALKDKLDYEFLKLKCISVDELHDPNLVQAYLHNLFIYYHQVLKQEKNFPCLHRNRFYDIANYLESLKKYVVISYYEDLLTYATILFLNPIKFRSDSDNTNLSNRMLFSLALYVSLSDLVVQDEHSYENNLKVAERILWYLEEKNHMNERDGYCNILLTFLQIILTRLQSSPFSKTKEISALTLEVFTHLISASNYPAEVRLADLYDASEFESIYQHLSPLLSFLTPEDNKTLIDRLYGRFIYFNTLKNREWLGLRTWAEFKVIQMLLSDLAPALDVKQLNYMMLTMPMVMSHADPEELTYLSDQPLFFVEKIVACLPKNYYKEAIELSNELFKLQNHETNHLLKSLYIKYNVILMLTYLDHTKPKFLAELVQILLSDSFFQYLNEKHFLSYFAAFFAKLPKDLRKNVINFLVGKLAISASKDAGYLFAIRFIKSASVSLTKPETDLLIVNIAKKDLCFPLLKEVLDALKTIKSKLDCTQSDSIFNILISESSIYDPDRVIPIIEARLLSPESETNYIVERASKMETLIIWYDEDPNYISSLIAEAQLSLASSSDTANPPPIPVRPIK